MINNKNIAIVLGLYETGLGVGRSLGRNGIRVIGLDNKKAIGFHSKYIEPRLCPHPSKEEKQFIDYLLTIAKEQKEKSILFITSDNFLLPISRNRKILNEHFLINLADEDIIESITNKDQQHKLAQHANTLTPKTYFPQNMDEVHNLKNALSYPAFIKAREVTSWRNKISDKGFLIHHEQDLIKKYQMIYNNGLQAIIQEVVTGPDTNHFKMCCYISQNNEMLLAFTLQKIRQYPIRFGTGSLVQSIHYPELLAAGKRLLKNIRYRGVGSAEFKLDLQDGKLKLIEINPRYWQQNALSEKCGMNFPLMHYLDLTGQNPRPINNFLEGIKWINISMDLKSYLSYRKLGELTFCKWLKSLKGKKTISTFAWDDIKPGFHIPNFSRKLIKLLKQLSDKRKRREEHL